ncbi:60S ribosomal protein l28, putative [Theileria annulata]|uniref:60S ribosomal protein l28, putative n=1 Tax=Theileria annulata TaxID=5874 RepID=Q4UBK1_THEAN|nr:60S ribosomal protein l28, putative [Theileria annulata]CAI75800.1 60S ribosomal protein l28, putative [Theileria annulata]|eukprot:XP_955276.1 60S ribosomal protein l28, putative [Theileria annulata]
MKSKSLRTLGPQSGTVPDCLLWELVRNNHAFLKKSRTTTFSLESHNLLSKHSPRFTVLTQFCITFVGYTNKTSYDVVLNSTGSLITLKRSNVRNSRRPSSKTSVKSLKKSLELVNSLKSTVKKDRPDLADLVARKFTMLTKSKTEEKPES